MPGHLLKDYGSVAPVLRGGGITFDEFALSLSPTIYNIFDEAASPIINYGSDGNSAAAANVTFSQTGQLGNACLFDGDTSVVTYTLASFPNTNALTSQRWMFLVHPTSLGEGSIGMWLTLGGTTRLLFQSTNRLLCVMNCGGGATNASVTTNNNEVTFLNSWALVFMDFDNSNVLGLGRRIRLFYSTAATPPTLMTLAADQAAGAAFINAAADFKLGNNAAGSGGFAGRFNRAFVASGVWSPAGTPADISTLTTLWSLAF